MKKIFTISFLLLFIGCATTYHPQSFTGGYHDQQLEKDILKVGFTGNGFTSKTVVDDYIIYRCAYLTKKHGYKYFTYLYVQDLSTTNYGTTPARTTGTITDYGSHVRVRTQTTGGNTYTVNKPAGAVEIKMFKKKPKNIEVRNANQILKYLNKKIVKSKDIHKINKYFLYIGLPLIILSNAYEYPPSLY